MPACPECGKQWPPGYTSCPNDGSRLSIAPAGVQGATAPATAGSFGPTLALAKRDEPDELGPGSIVGEYRIENKLGEGGMGTVYGARHPLIGKRVAIKVIKRELSASKDAVERFTREAQAINQIGHANIVDVFNFGTLPDGR